MTEPHNLALAHLGANRGEVTKVADWMQTLTTETTPCAETAETKIRLAGPRSARAW